MDQYYSVFLHYAGVVYNQEKTSALEPKSSSPILWNWLIPAIWKAEVTYQVSHSYQVLKSGMFSVCVVG